METLLRVRDLIKTYGANTVLTGVSFDLARGETKVVIGPSGTGKSTLLRCINRLSPPDGGHVTLDGIEITGHEKSLNRIRTRMGFVFQSFNLFSHLTALGNVRIGPMRVKGMTASHSAPDHMCRMRTVR